MGTILLINILKLLLVYKDLVQFNNSLNLIKWKVD